jgi:hypothetical protein
MSTQSLIIIGETGASYLINSISELKSVCENYFNQLGITQNDISIINNIDQNFIYLNNLEYKPDSKYFILVKDIIINSSRYFGYIKQKIILTWYLP